jgi:virginiamycin B lyase
MDSNNVPWIVEFGSHKLATIDPETLVLREIALPREEARPRRMEIDSNDAIWYVDYANGMIGRYDQSTAQFQEWETPGGANSRPYGTAMDDQDRLWFVESGLQPNQFIGFDPSTDDFFSITPIESGGGTVRHMYYYAPAQEIWFGTDTNTIGRTKIP